MKKVKFQITQQGGPLINSGYVVAEAPNVVAVQIDMESKRCEVAGTGNTGEHPCLMVEAGSYGLHLKKGSGKEWTEIEFPDYKGFDIMCANISRYTLSICFVKYPDVSEEVFGKK